MPLENIDLSQYQQATERPLAHQRALYDSFGVVSNPFPSASETSGHRRMPTEADAEMDQHVGAFCRDARSVCIAVTATQGVGKTNLLTAYEEALNEKLGLQGFFVIRYLSDPEESFDKMMRAVMEPLTEEFLRTTIDACAEKGSNWEQAPLARDFRVALSRMVKARAAGNLSHLGEQMSLAREWLLGLPVRKAHRDVLGVTFRLDTVESKTRALRDLVAVGKHTGTLQGVFLLLDELEKHAGILSRAGVVRYLLSLRALIDALPECLFLMLALTSDALNRYSEMVPALQGRIAATIQLQPIGDGTDAVALWEFYLKNAQAEAQHIGTVNRWGSPGADDVVTRAEAIAIYKELAARGPAPRLVRQREYLNQLHDKAKQVMAPQTRSANGRG